MWKYHFLLGRGGGGLWQVLYTQELLPLVCCGPLSTTLRRTEANWDRAVRQRKGAGLPPRASNGSSAHWLSPSNPSHTHYMGADQGPHSLGTRWTDRKIMIKPCVHRKGTECTGMVGGRHTTKCTWRGRGGGWPGLQSDWLKDR